MKHSSFNYVRLYRKRYALSERELGFLLDGAGQDFSARIEHGDRRPRFRVALALQVLFRQEPRQLFPDYYEWVEDGVMRRAAILLERLGEKADPVSKAKREFLEGLARADNAQEG